MMSMATSTKPMVDPPILEAIPTELKELSQWVMWKYELRTPKKGPAYWTKVPFGTRGRDGIPAPAKANDPRTWLPFTVAESWRKQYGFDGIGFEFHPDGPYFGVDLDDCRITETGEILPNALAIIRRFNTYTEISPSGTGVKLIARGRFDLPPKKDGKPTSGRRRSIEWAPAQVGEIECYDSNRYFAITGKMLEIST